MMRKERAKKGNNASSQSVEALLEGNRKKERKSEQRQQSEPFESMQDDSFIRLASQKEGTEWYDNQALCYY
jgi:hypothetical protein